LVKRFEDSIKSCLNQLSAYQSEIEGRRKKAEEGALNRQKGGGKKNKNTTFTLSYGDQSAAAGNHGNRPAGGGPARDHGRFRNKSPGNKSSSFRSPPNQHWKEGGCHNCGEGRTTLDVTQALMESSSVAAQGQTQGQAHHASDRRTRNQRRGNGHGQSAADHHADNWTPRGQRSRGGHPGNRGGHFGNQVDQQNPLEQLCQRSESRSYCGQQTTSSATSRPKPGKRAKFRIAPDSETLRSDGRGEASQASTAQPSTSTGRTAGRHESYIVLDTVLQDENTPPLYSYRQEDTTVSDS